MRRTEVAWAAGLFEGEGCITFTKDRAVVSITSTDRDVVERFAALIGCGGITYTSDKRPRTKPHWAWRASARPDVVRVLRLLRPWLGSRRGRKADECLALIERKTDTPGWVKRRLRHGASGVRR